MESMNLSTAACVRRVRASLPAEAFQPNTGRLWTVATHAAIIGVSYATVRRMPAVGPVAALVIGHSLACVAFVGHEASHQAVVRHRVARYALEFLLFGLNMVPPTMWNRLHNLTHHHHAGTPRDPDRPFLETERSPSTTWYARLFYPSSDRPKGYVLVLCHFVTYLGRNIATVFYPDAKKPAIVTSKPAYRPRERVIIAVELLLMAALQYGVWVAVGRSWTNYLWVSPVALCVTSAILMAYVFTQHFLNPITHDHDPLGGTTSVMVPRLIDRWHGYFSYHTEHHLFPSMNTDYYPAVSEALKRESGGRYQQLPISEAWRRLWQQQMFRRVEGSAPGE
jgi:fatty acid desaturase